MKRIFAPLILILLLSLTLVAARPLPQAAGEPNLSLEQLGLLGAVAMAAVWFLTVVYTGVLKQPKPTKRLLQTIVFVGSVVLAYFWTPLQLPAFPVFGGDPTPFAIAILEWAGFLLASAVTIFKLAQLIFDVLWAPIMGWLDAKILAPAAAKAAGKPLAVYSRSFRGFLRPVRA